MLRRPVESRSTPENAEHRGAGELLHDRGEPDARRSREWRPERGQWLVFGFGLVALWAVVLLSLTEVLAPGFWLVRALSIGAAAVLVAMLCAMLAPRSRVLITWSGPVAGFACWLAWFVLGGRPPEWWRAWGDQFGEVSRRIVEESPPVEMRGPLEDFLLLVMWTVVSVVAVIMFRARQPLIAGGLTVGFLLVTPAITGLSLQWPFLLAAGLLFALLIWARSPAPNRLGLTAAVLAVAMAAGIVHLAPETRDRIWNTSLLPAPVSSAVPDVTITLANDLRERSNARAFRFDSNWPGAHRFTLATLVDFDGGRWLPQDTVDPAGLNVGDARSAASLPPAQTREPQSQLTTVTITIEGLLSSWLPLPQSSLRVSEASPGGGFDIRSWQWMEDSNTAFSERQMTRRGQRYLVEAQPLAAASLPYYDALNQHPLIADPSAVSEQLAPYLALPGELPELIAQTAEQATAGATDRLTAARMLQLWFQNGDYVYDESAPYLPGSDADDPYAVMEALLTDRSGFCVHYATTFAIMARHVGMPARVAVGYAVRADRDSSTTVRGRDLHAWPEIYLDDVGWIAFEPTPGGAGLRAETGEDVPPVPEADLETAEAETPVVQPEVQPGEVLELEEWDGLDPSADTGGGSTLALLIVAWTLAALALLALLLPMSVRLVRGARRRRAMARRIRPAANAWDEVRDTATDLGLLAFEGSDDAEPPRAQTAEGLVDHLAARELLPGEAEAAARRIVAAMNVERYSGPRADDAGGAPGTAAVAELRRSLRLVRGRLRSSSSFAARLRAFWFPRSVRRERR